MFVLSGEMNCLVQVFSKKTLLPIPNPSEETVLILRNRFASNLPSVNFIHCQKKRGGIFVEFGFIFLDFLVSKHLFC